MLNRYLLILFSATLFLSAALLFWIQPLLAKMILPYLGGSPSVWNTCMMFFQGTLLIGYIYAHGLARLPTPFQVVIHLTLLALGIFFLPPAIHSSWVSITESPIFTLVTTLLHRAALPLIAISATAPLLQKWFASTKHPDAEDPYFLYSSSNAGSLLALLAFPFIFEPLLTLSRQSYLWAGGFFLLMILTLLCGLSCGTGSPKTLSSNTTMQRKAYWLALSFAPSSLLLGVTTYITTDIASTPLFWVIPLALYILTFILAFARKQLIKQSTAQIVQFSLLLPLLIIMLKPLFAIALSIKLFIHLTVFTSTAYVCHTELVKYRPRHENLTTFYVWIALGGFLGGAFNTLIAPLLFSDTTEYPIILLFALFLVIPAFLTRKMVTAVIVLFLFSSSYFASPYYKSSILTSRNFFGTTRVVDNKDGIHYLVHGSTVHGLQDRNSGHEKEVLSYYSALKKMVAQKQLENTPLNIGILGLGTGSCACLSHEHDITTVYEINPDMIAIASNPRYFSFLNLCPPKGGIIIGDARLKMQSAANKSYDIMILDAFSSDSMPVHLLTIEAIRLYLDKLKDDGLLMINISNRFIDLKKVISAIMQSENLAGMYTNTGSDYKNHLFAASWVVLTKTQRVLDQIKPNAKWIDLPKSDASYLWTDDYSNIVRSLHILSS